jgi:hypothetical protein
VNKEQRAVKSFLQRARKGHGVQLSRDEIAEGLEAFEARTERRDFLRPKQIRELLNACAKHDAATFKVTCKEHDGRTPSRDNASVHVDHGVRAPPVVDGLARLGSA